MHVYIQTHRYNTFTFGEQQIQISVIESILSQHKSDTAIIDKNIRHRNIPPNFEWQIKSVIGTKMRGKGDTQKMHDHCM